MMIAFKCVHIWKEQPEKDNIFDPTPSSQVSYKVRRIPFTSAMQGPDLSQANWQIYRNFTLPWKW